MIWDQETIKKVRAAKYEVVIGRDQLREIDPLNIRDAALAECVALFMNAFPGLTFRKNDFYYYTQENFEDLGTRILIFWCSTEPECYLVEYDKSTFQDVMPSMLPAPIIKYRVINYRGRYSHLREFHFKGWDDQKNRWIYGYKDSIIMQNAPATTHSWMTGETHEQAKQRIDGVVASMGAYLGYDKEKDK